ncbi:MAG: response regulator [Prochloraceae cyanobacterium]
MNEDRKNIAKQLNSLSLERFTGRVDIRSVNDLSWNIFLRLGRIVWAKGGEHPNRSWQRYFNKNCPQIDLKNIDIASAEKFECVNYQALIELFDRKEINKEQLKAIIKSNIEDIIFDLIQEEAGERIYCEIQPEYESPLLESALKISFALVEIEETTARAEQKWRLWQEHSLGFYNPNAAPKMKNQAELQSEVSEAVYQNFVRLFNGNNTLRDLAYLMDIDVNRISFSLLPYIEKGLLDLEEIEDIQTPITIGKQTSKGLNKKARAKKDRYRQKIICIDDSPQVCYLMKQIVSRAGYDFAEINEPLYAIPKLIEDKPDLIFLDLGMPIVNGYEMCSQIKRISHLKELPIIILTSQDTIVDRMRAKIVGATDFISKPIEEVKIMNAVNRYLLLEKKKRSKKLKINGADKKLTKRFTT